MFKTYVFWMAKILFARIFIICPSNEQTLKSYMRRYQEAARYNKEEILAMKNNNSVVRNLDNRLWRLMKRSNLDIELREGER